MQTGYGPALLLGVLIGGAILLDDVITPDRKNPPPRLTMFQHGEGIDNLKALSPSEEHNVWVIRSDDGGATKIHKEIKVELASEGNSAEAEQLMISVSVDADDEPTGDLAAAIGAVIDSARTEGRQPTKEEIEAAVSAIASDARSIDVEVLPTGD